jgi:hypothetical protein
MMQSADFPDLNDPANLWVANSPTTAISSDSRQIRFSRYKNMNKLA